MLSTEKETQQVLTYLADAGLNVAPECNGVVGGYEIHMGLTTLEKDLRPFARIFRRGDAAVSVEDGAVSSDGRIFGSYLHGLFENDQFRSTYLNSIRGEKGMAPGEGTPAPQQLDAFDQLAEQFAAHLDLPRLLAICGLASDSD